MAHIVLIPGAGGDPWYWHPVAAQLRDRGHEVVAVDLPGPDPHAGLAEYVEIVIAATVDTDDVVLVGQSLGGFTAAASASRLKPRLLVYVNAMIPVPGETAGEWWANTGQAAAKARVDEAAGRRPDDPFDLDFTFLHDVPASVLAASPRAPLDEADAVFASPSMIETQPDVPTRVVVGSDERFFPAEFQIRVAKERLGIGVDLVPGGHLAALSHPVELTDLLVAYLSA